MIPMSPRASLSLQKIRRCCEEDGGFEFKVRLSRPAEQTTRVSYKTRAKEVSHTDKLEYNNSASATENVDYPSQRGTLTFNEGEQEKTVSFSPINDNMVEADRELFEVELYDYDTSHVTPRTTVVEFAIQDIDETTISLSRDGPEVSEDIGSFNYTIHSSHPVADYLSFDMSFAKIEPGSSTHPLATPGEDFESGSVYTEWTVQERAQDLMKTGSFEIFDDEIVEGPEDFLIELLKTNGMLARVIFDLSAAGPKIITILDNDMRGIQFVPQHVDVVEGESFTYQVGLTSSLKNSLNMTLSTSNPGMSISPTSLTFNPTTNSEGVSIRPPLQEITVQIAHDEDEQDEDYSITHALSNIGSSDSKYGNITIPPLTVRVYDDEGMGVRPIPDSEVVDGWTDDHRTMDGPSVNFGRQTAEGHWLTEGWSQNFLVRIRGGFSGPQQVRLNVGGTMDSNDYSLEVGGRKLQRPYQVTIPDGEREVILTVKILRDGNESEGVETLTLNGTHADLSLNGGVSHTINISPCGGHPEAFVWFSVDGENPLKRHHHYFNTDDPIQGPSFKLRVCFRDPVQETGGFPLHIWPASSESGVGVQRQVGGTLSNKRQRATGHIWNWDVTADGNGAMTFDLSMHLNQLQYANGTAINSPTTSFTWSPLVTGIDEQTPLTASFETAPPREHDAAYSFTFCVAFSAQVPLSVEEMQNALQVQGGSVTSVEPVAGEQKRKWDFTVEPSGSEDVTVTLPVPSECGGSNICTLDGRRLSESLTATINGPADPATGALTGRFFDAPKFHDGFNSFTLKLEFSEAVTANNGTIGRALRYNGRQRYHNQNGGIRSVAQIDGRSDLWEITVEPFIPEGTYPPSSREAINLTLGSPDSCDADGAICTSRGRARALSNTPQITIHPPVYIEILDATAREGVDENINFQITFSSPLQSSASVYWTTNDGSAKNGEDFRGGTGTLKFDAGDIEAVLSFAIIDDAVDEGREIFTVSLENPRGVSFATYRESSATGIIDNDDPMSRAWLARFGRTVGSQAVEAVSSRMDPSSEDTNRVVIGGVEVTSGSSGSDSVENLEERILRERLRQNAFSWKSDRGLESRQEMTMEELLLGSSFSLRGPGSEAGGDNWSLWGKAFIDSFEGAEDDVGLQGEVKSGFLGVELTSGNWKGGMAFSQSQGKGTFDLLDEGSLEDSGRVESNMTGLYPYLGYNWGENKALLWALLGSGEGDMTLVQNADEDRLEDKVTKTDISMRMGAIGAKTPLMSQSEGGAADVLVKIDGMYVRTSSEVAEGMEAAETYVSRLRLMIDSSRTFEIGRGVLTPSFQMGVRHDAGDAEEGVGLEAGGKFVYRRGSLTIEGSVRKLLAHEDDNYEEWGASAALRLDPGESGRGLSLSVSPTWGDPSSGVDNLWNVQGAHQLGRGDFVLENRLEAEIGYGIWSPFKKLFGIFTPYYGLSRGDSNRGHRLGTRWEISPKANMGLELSRTKGETEEDDDKAIMIQGNFRW